VFPGRGKTGHLVEPKTCWKRVLNRAGISDLRLHDLRRTLGSWQAIQGAGLPIVGKSLGQSSIHATAVYAHLVTDPVRASVNKATTALLEAGGVAGLLGSAK
jgi:integrase